MERLLLKPVFIDRGGRTVYNIHLNSGKGQLIGQVRMKVGKDLFELEWLNDCEVEETDSD